MNVIKTLRATTRNALATSIELINFMNDHLPDLAEEQQAEYDALYEAFEEARNALSRTVGI